MGLSFFTTEKAILMADEKWFPATDGAEAQGRFEMFSKLMVAESREADKEIYREIIVLRHKFLGSGDISVTPVKPHNQAQLVKRFPEAWAEFKKSHNLDEVKGTPLSSVEWLSEEQCLACAAQGYSSLEELAEMPDATCSAMGFGWRTRRDQARKAVNAAPAEPAKKKRGRPRKIKADAA